MRMFRELPDEERDKFCREVLQRIRRGDSRKRGANGRFKPMDGFMDSDPLTSMVADINEPKPKEKRKRKVQHIIRRNDLAELGESFLGVLKEKTNRRVPSSI